MAQGQKRDLFPDGWRQSTRYPDPAITALDPRFEKYWIKLSCVERLATGCRWSEGPVWMGDSRMLLWSDIPNNRILRWDECTGTVGVFRQPSQHANGHVRDRQGRLVSCEHLTRRITRTELDGKITVLADNYQGKKFNSPNDLTVDSKGRIYFTDPRYGKRDGMEMIEGVYRIDAPGQVTRVLGDSDVVVLVGPFVCELLEAGPASHRGGDADYPRVPCRLADQGVGEDLRVLRRSRLRLGHLEDLGSDRGRGIGFLHRDQLRLRVGRSPVDDRAGLESGAYFHPVLELSPWGLADGAASLQ